MKNKVTSLELSKKLKDLGVKQESAFYWVSQTIPSQDYNFEVQTKEYSEEWGMVKHSAFLSCELGEMLPDEVEIKEESYFMEYGIAFRGGWQIYLRQNGSTGYQERYSFEAETEAEARGKMLVYLLENNLIEL